MMWDEVCFFGDQWIRYDSQSEQYRGAVGLQMDHLPEASLSTISLCKGVCLLTRAVKEIRLASGESPAYDI